MLVVKIVFSNTLKFNRMPNARDPLNLIPFSRAEGGSAAYFRRT
jgi:hypothetical protein